MIIDSIENASQYSGIGEGIRKALDYLGATDFAGMAPGRYEIDGTTVFALVQSYETKPRDSGVWEAHRLYADVQYMVSGVETMGYAPLTRLATTTPYSPEKDCELFDGAAEGAFLRVDAGSFAIFFPQDGHMPCLACGNPEPVRKVVVKVAMDAIGKDRA